ncbi:hypothetical protein [Acidianus sp. HS-5]|uniref:hypothetical protein n=1 Tax=Acidianus sp. HS-5 TaxID=2886040 RepID=UPI001F1B133F|nr:hypothetical protein [Acidianus sp. HS-5]BDC18579.1 hypothetical protein HS5_14690 [Acidianus sp. HS-5]
MQKSFIDKNINIQKLVQDIQNSLNEDGWETNSNPYSQTDYLVKGQKKGHFHKAEEILIRIRGDPNNVLITVEEENIGSFGRAWINLKLLGEIERKVNDGFYS